MLTLAYILPLACASGWQGYETTANALAFTMFLLATHPEAERGVRAEVRQELLG